jgi:hypothetical protein
MTPAEKALIEAAMKWGTLPPHTGFDLEVAVQKALIRAVRRVVKERRGK